MRKLIVSMNLSLNGCMAGADGGLQWHHDHWSEDMARAITRQLADADTILLGRITYLAMATHWRADICNGYGARQDIDFADMMSSYVKVVVSRTLTANACLPNTRLIKDNIANEVAVVKRQPGKNIIVYGSGMLVDALAGQGLVDEYRLWVHPVIIGLGRPLFSKLQANLMFTGMQVFDTGVVLMCYRPV